MTDWFSYNGGKPFLCGDCHKEVPENGKRWWNKNNKQSICDDCYSKKNTNIQSSPPPSSSKEARTPEPTTKCDVCGDVVASGKEVHHVLRGGKWFTVCFYCFNTIRRVRAIKVAGLWPFEKKKDYMAEEYGLSPSSATPSVGSPSVPSADGEKD